MPRSDPAARKAYNQQYWATRYADPVWQEARREYQRQYRANHPEVAKLTPIYRQRWHAKNPDRVKECRDAGRAVAGAIRRGELTRPGACEECHLACRPEAAHHDYAKPLDVRWLCKSCHSLWDQTSPKTGS